VDHTALRTSTDYIHQSLPERASKPQQVWPWDLPPPSGAQETGKPTARYVPHACGDATCIMPN